MIEFDSVEYKIKLTAAIFMYSRFSRRRQAGISKASYNVYDIESRSTEVGGR